MSVVRNRPVERKWIGQRIDGPPPDLAGFARSLGAHGIGPVERREQIGPAIAEGIKHVRAGGVCVIDVIVRPEYTEAAAAGVIGAGQAKREHDERG
jgi:thiamine pyrophosphate-dependent acetolactate synthase large subunit-like protein